MIERAQADLRPPVIDFHIYLGDPPTIELYAYGVAAWSSENHIMQVRTSEASDVVATFTVTMTPTGNADLDLVILLTADQPFDLTAGRYFYDVQATVNGAPTGVTRFRGFLYIEQDITR